MSQFRTLMAGAHVHVLGSAPGACLPPDDHPYILMAVNGSFLPWPDLVPDILLINGHTVVSADPVQQMTRRAMQGRRVGHMLGIANLAGPEHFAALGLHWDGMEMIDRTQRQQACEQATRLRFPGDRGEHIPSSGVTALCLAINAGVQRLTCSGISLTGGYSYDPGDHVRKHVDVDRRALQALGIDGERLDPALVQMVSVAAD